MSFSEKYLKYIVLLVLIISGISLYQAGFTIPYYSDDFEVIIESTTLNVFSYFIQTHPDDFSYRPVQAALLGLIQFFYYLDPLPVHIVLLCMHIVLSWMVFLFMKEYGFPGKHAAIGSLFMLISQANAYALLSNDTISQVSGTLFGCMSLFLLFYCHNNRTGCIYKNKYYYLSIAAFLFSLLSQETNAVLLVSLILLTFLFYRIKHPLKKAFLLSGSHSLLFIITLIVYLIARSLVITETVSTVASAENMIFGFTILINFGQLLLASLVPASSVTTFLAYQTGDFTFLSLILMTTILLGLYAGYGIWRSSYCNLAFAIGGFAIISILPALSFIKVSELNVYSVMPFIAVLIGAGLGVQLENIQWRGVKKIAAPALLMLLCISHVFAIREKAVLMYYNGIRSTYLLEQITNHGYRVPIEGNLLLMNPESNEYDYSIYLMSGFNVLDRSFNRINFLLNRYDMSVKIIEESDLPTYEGRDDSIILSLRNDIVYVYEKGK